jgi:Ni/Fe-hydrogenase subunit HybB-like protein
MNPEEFDGSMMFAMKTVLSYYEVKRDRILSDYLYILALPLLVKNELLLKFKIKFKKKKKKMKFIFLFYLFIKSKFLEIINLCIKYLQI